MPERPFHHGNLRTALLDRAEVVLRRGGVETLSLRELARDAGVSHGAPRSHFIDRNALLDALAERGFARLVDEIRTAALAADEYPAMLSATAAAYLEFAVHDAALLDLMFAAKVERPSAALDAAAGLLFTTVSGIVGAGVATGVLAAQHVERATLLWGATLQGASALVTSKRTSLETARTVVDDAVALFLSGTFDDGRTEH